MKARREYQSPHHRAHSLWNQKQKTSMMSLVYFFLIIIVEACKASSATKANCCTAIMEEKLVGNLTASHYPCKASAQSVAAFLIIGTHRPRQPPAPRVFFAFYLTREKNIPLRLRDRSHPTFLQLFKTPCGRFFFSGPFSPVQIFCVERLHSF